MIEMLIKLRKGGEGNEFDGIANEINKIANKYITPERTDEENGVIIDVLMQTIANEACMKLLGRKIEVVIERRKARESEGK